MSEVVAISEAIAMRFTQPLCTSTNNIQITRINNRCKQQSTQMKKYTNFIVLFLTMSSLTLVSCQHQQHKNTTLACFLEPDVSSQCILSVNKNEMASADPEVSAYICQYIVKMKSKFMATKQIANKVVEICKISSQLNGHHPEAHYLLFQAHLKSGNFQEALNTEYAVFFEHPFQHEARMKEILTEQFRQQLALQSQNKEQSLIDRAILLNYIGESSQAELAIDSILQQNNNVPQALKFLKLRIMDKNNEFHEGLNYVEKELKLSPHWYFYHQKGNFLMHHLKFNEAIRNFQTSLQRNTGKQFAFSSYNIGLCYQKIADFDSSLQYLKRSLLIDQEAAETLNAIGYAYYVKSHSEENALIKNKFQITAESYFKKAIKANSEYFISYFNYGMLMMDRNESSSAVALFYKCLEHCPSDFISPQYAIFKLKYALDQKQGFQYLESIKANPNYKDSEVGQLFYQLGNYGLALQYLNKAEQQQKSKDEIYEWKGLVLFELNSYDEALQNFDKAVSRGNNKATIQFNMGYIYQQKRNYEKSKQHYQRSLQMGNENNPAKQRLRELNRVMSENRSEL